MMARFIKHSCVYAASRLIMIEDVVEIISTGVVQKMQLDVGNEPYPGIVLTEHSQG